MLRAGALDWLERKEAKTGAFRIFTDLGSF
jgi:hypothetical protein